MKKKAVAVVGVGLIGGSLCKAMKKYTDARVLGHNRTKATEEAALQNGDIDAALTDENLSTCDLVLVALYPQGVIDFVKEHMDAFAPGAIIVDMTGVKTRICTELSGRCAARGVRFIGGHPMAGTENSGYKSADADLFRGATMLLCRDEHTDEAALDSAAAFFMGLGFGEVKVTTPEEHDAIIAYTSQLAHVASNAYIKSPTAARQRGFSAGSYKDLTRVAKLNAPMWTELFLENREPLLREVETLIENLEDYRAALEAGDSEILCALLREGSLLKERDEAGERAQ